ncbi:MAG: hypothetical protein AB7U75_17230 [Hyphomicrobiaceae bacterium]
MHLATATKPGYPNLDCLSNGGFFMIDAYNPAHAVAAEFGPDVEPALAEPPI